MTNPKNVLIVGAGLAGLTSAFRLAQQGYRVTVLEKRSVLGGRTSSWQERGLPVDSGLHKILGIYRAMPALLKDVGVNIDDITTWVDAVEFHSPKDSPPHGYFTAAPFHRPLATIRDILTTTYLSWSERLRVARLALHGLYDITRHPDQLDQQSIVDYARQYGVSETTLRKVFIPLTQGVFFLPPQRYSAYGTFAPVIAGIKNGGTFRVGAFRGGMTDVLINPIVTAIKKSGGSIYSDVAIADLIIKSNQVIGARSNTQEYFADHVIIATPLAETKRLLEPLAAHYPWIKSLSKLNTVSTISVQFSCQSPVFPTDHTHFSTTALACFADQTHTTFTQDSGRFSGILHPADALIDSSDADIIAHTLAAADQLQIPIPPIKQAVVVRHPHEFYAIEPGAERLRPLGPTPTPGLTLAGDYIKQPFLASMEGAIISGNRAAAAINNS